MMIYKVRIKKKYPFKQMSPGAKSWVFRYMLDARSREMGLGATHALTLWMFVARKNSRTTTAVCVSAQFRFLSLNRMTAIIVAALLKWGETPGHGIAAPIGQCFGLRSR